MKLKFTHGLIATGLFLLAVSCAPKAPALPETVTLSKAELQNKIKGGWAGQTIGCTYGGFTEFKYLGGMIHDYVKLELPDTIFTWWYDHIPGLYDDVYMDVTFVKVFNDKGLDAPVDEFANAFAHAGYWLWHANQAARFNILRGIKAPESGHWKNNPHAEDLDFQIEADFAGLMAPGMVNSAAEVCDKIGHIMNYGDGYYGGLYVAAMYSLAFVSNDIEWVVTEALKVIPTESKYYQCMADVIASYKKYPDDWKRTWLEVERNWAEDLFCPGGVFRPYNIDATVNSAYVLIGLLYGEGDFTKTMEISTRCGQDSDCNPATAVGILGVMIGYDNIPKEYLKALAPVEGRNFAHAEASLNDIYKMSFDQALQMVERGGGKVTGDQVEIKVQVPAVVPFEENFPGYYPTERKEVRKSIEKIGNYTFDGKGIVFLGHVAGDKTYAAEVEMYIDGVLAEAVKLPVAFETRREEITFAFELPNAKHTATFVWKNPVKGAEVFINEALVFGDKPAK